MNDHELLMRIWEKVEYLNHKTTQIETDMSWLKWLVCFLVLAVMTQAITAIWKYTKNNK